MELGRVIIKEVENYWKINKLIWYELNDGKIM